MNILITGTHGFVGNNLIATLKKHHNIYGLDIVSPQKEGVFKTYSWNELNIIPAVDVIIHLSGKAHDTKNTSSDQEYFDINVGLTQKIFNHFIQSSATKFIFFSSVKAVADSVIGSILTEDTPPNPKTAYGKSKLEAEQYIMDQHSFPDKLVYILRPCMIHGPNNKGNLSLLYKLTQKGIPWPLGAFENRRSFISILNLQYVIKELIEKNIESGIYQLADDETLSTNELISLMTDSLNKKARIWNISPYLIKFIAKMGDKFGLPLNSERLKKLTESYVVSNLKLKKALRIDKMPCPAIEGMKNTFDSLL